MGLLLVKKKPAELVFRAGRSGGPSLWGVCLVGYIGSFREKVVSSPRRGCNLDSVLPSLSFKEKTIEIENIKIEPRNSHPVRNCAQGM